MANRLFISFWDLCLQNLPAGSFKHRVLPTETAKAMIAQAQTEGKLQGVSADDLIAPYHQREMRKHEELCQALCEHIGIQLSLEDFTLNGEDCVSIYPLDLVEVRADQPLIVVSCCYSHNPEQQQLDPDSVSRDFGFQVAPETITFHLIEISK